MIWQLAKKAVSISVGYFFAREHILTSEKVFDYKLKLKAIAPALWPDNLANWKDEQVQKEFMIRYENFIK